jgi:hypothetical protein
MFAAEAMFEKRQTPSSFSCWSVQENGTPVTRHEDIAMSDST